MAISTLEVIRKIDAVLSRYMSPYAEPKADKFGRSSTGTVAGWVISTTETIRRFAPPGSPYLTRAVAAAESSAAPSYALEVTAGILKALRADYEDGLLVDLTELVHADLFDDFLDMAAHLLESGYKDPAAVLTGSVLEEHLRKLATKHGVPLLKESGEPEKTESLNSSFAKQGVYSKSEQKQITAWLGLRNDAAHGHYDRYTDGEVTLMIQGVRGFIIRYPA